MERGDPDALTPREQQVLDLLKRGYSNRDIAKELQISLSGAKYHVSEIISKLGVSSREEAAGLEGTRRAWSFLPSLPLLTGIREFVTTLTASKLAIGALVPLAVVGIAAGGYGALRALDTGESAADLRVEDGLRPLSNQCVALFTYQCLQSESEDYNTLEEAVANASFQPAMPDYIPDGFQPILIRHTRPEGTEEFIHSESFKEGCPGCDPRLSHNDQIGVYYRDDEGRQLAIVQGSPAYLPLHQSAPEDSYGMVTIGRKEAIWVQGLPIPGPDADPNEITLYWDVGRIEVGSDEVLPENDYVVGSPFGYSISTNGLTLDELIKIAESVSFD
jgi:DNA-binding CsgD family transcriptional regulator